MRNIIKGYFVIKQRLVDNQRIFNEITEYLMPGEYKCNAAGNILYRNGHSKGKNITTFNESDGKNPLANRLTKRYVLKKQ